VLISPFLHDDKVDVYVVSDKLQPLSGTIHMRLLDFSGNSLLDQTKDIQIPAQSSAIYFSLDRATFAAKADLKKSFALFDLEIGGKRVSRNLIFFDVTHDLDLPVAPKIETTVAQDGKDYVLTLKSAQLARNVYVSFGDLDVQASDNYFDLLPSEPLTIRLRANTNLQQVQKALNVMSLTEAFNAK
jgi:beta-mannosidase